MQDTTELWEILAETLESLAEHHSDIKDTDLWVHLVNNGLILKEENNA